MHSTHTGLPDPEFQAEFYADIPTKRFVAWLIDGAIVLVLAIIALPFTAFLGVFFFPALAGLISFIYRVITITGGSATLGMRLMAIELRDRDGDRLSFGLAIAHTTAYFITFFSIVFEIISIVLMLTSARKQGLHDVILGTAALNRAAQM